MEKKIVTALVLCCLGAAGSAVAAANTETITLNITGSVQDSTAGCVVALDQAYMDLGVHDIADLPEQGHYKDTTSGYHNTVKMSGANCKNNSGNSVAIRFTGNAVGTAFKNSSSDSTAAQGVGVEVYGYGKNIINPNTSDVPTYNSQYPFYVGIVKMRNATPTAGSVKSTITVEVDRL